VDERKLKERRAREYAKLDRMVAYTRAPCRRRFIVEYFGERAPFERCGTCDACRAGVALSPTVRACTPDERTVVTKLLSCLARMERHASLTGWSLDLLVHTVLGKADERTRSLGFEGLSTWGILGVEAAEVRWSAAEVQDLVRASVEAGLLAEAWETRKVAGKDRTYRTYAVAGEGWRVLRDPGVEVRMAFPHGHKLVLRRPVADVAAGVSPELLGTLRDLRARLARDEGVPAYVVASNRTIEDMARLRPSTKTAMLAVHGMGEVRWHKYGAAFLEAVRSHREG
jgi:ATP-dependent DNA helicase RecQ